MGLIRELSVMGAIAVLCGCSVPQERDEPRPADGAIPAEERGGDAPPAEPAGPGDDREPGDEFGEDDWPDGLIVRDVRRGEGEEVGPSSLVVARLVGRIEDGPVFHRAEEPEGPWPVASLIDGLTRGMQGMREGGRRRITIPPALAYGDRGITDPETGESIIPPGSTLIYEVELVEVLGRSAAGDGPPADPAGPEENS